MCLDSVCMLKINPFILEVENFEFVREIHVCDLHIFKEEDFEDKNYFVPFLNYVVFQK